MHRDATPLHGSSPTTWKEDVEWEEATEEGPNLTEKDWKKYNSKQGMRKYKDWKIKVE